MRILHISQYAGSPRHGMMLRPFYLSREWVRSGHEVSIVAGSYSHLRLNNPESTCSDELIEGVKYSWIRCPVYRGNGPARFWNMIVYVTRLALTSPRVAKQVDPDLVVCASTHPLDVFPAHWIARRCGARFVFEGHDLWPLTPIQVGGMSRLHPVIMLMQAAEDYMCRHVDRLISMFSRADSYYRTRGLPDGRCSYIPIGIDVDEWETVREAPPDKHLEVIERLREDGRFILGYAGGMGAAYDMDTLVEAADLLKNEPVSVVLIGRGPDEERLRRKIEQMGLEHVHMLPHVPRRALANVLELMDALTINWYRKPLYHYGVSPNKLMDYMMAAKPVIQGIDSPDDWVRESGCGLSIAPEDPRSLADAVRGLMSLPESRRDEMGRRGSAWVKERHDYRRLAAKFLEEAMSDGGKDPRDQRVQPG